MARKRNRNKKKVYKKKVYRTRYKIARPPLRSITYKPYTVASVAPQQKPLARHQTPRVTIKKTRRNKIKPLTISTVGGNIKKSNVCKRRHERKEIIHAINKAGISGQKARRSKTHNIKC